MDSLIENITGYVETRIELLKLEMKEEVARAIAKVVVYFFIISVFTLFILLISMAGAYKIGESVGTFGGFAIVAGFYLLMGLLVVAFRGAITQMIENRVQEKMKKKKS